MPQSLHKILTHGNQVIRLKRLPMGMLSEEAKGSRNKEFKKFREHFERKCSRVKTNEDLMRRLFCSSDPFITSLRKSEAPRKKNNLPIEPLDLIKENYIAFETVFIKEKK